MFIFSNFIIALAKVVDIILTIYYWLILIRALISWVNPDPFNPIVEFLHRTTEPLLQPIRNKLPALPLDISPMVLVLAIIFFQTFIVNTIKDYAHKMKQENRINYIQAGPSSQLNKPFYQ